MELWDIIQAVNLAPEQPDSIIWTLTTDSTYSASSAYKAQFFGGQARFLATKIWAAHAEPKCKLFGWLALHGKLLTADMLAIRGWPHEPLCPLCLHAPETANHLCKDCPFTIAIWNRMKTWDNDDSPDNRHVHQSITEWWDDLISGKAIWRSPISQRKTSSRGIVPSTASGRPYRPTLTDLFSPLFLFLLFSLRGFLGHIPTLS